MKSEMLTAEHGWGAQCPGFVYWRGKAIEHISTHGEKEVEKVRRRLEKICLKMESLGLTPTWYISAQWKQFVDLEKMGKPYWIYFVDGDAEFYVDKQGVPVFVRVISETRGYVREIETAKWDGASWIKERARVESPEVIYKQMTSMGYKHGSTAIGEVNLCGAPAAKIVAYFSKFNVPQESPWNKESKDEC